ELPPALAERGERALELRQVLVLHLGRRIGQRLEAERAKASPERAPQALELELRVQDLTVELRLRAPLLHQRLEPQRRLRHLHRFGRLLLGGPLGVGALQLLASGRDLVVEQKPLARQPLDAREPGGVEPETLDLLEIFGLAEPPQAGPRPVLSLAQRGLYLGQVDRRFAHAAHLIAQALNGSFVEARQPLGHRELGQAPLTHADLALEAAEVELGLLPLQQELAPPRFGALWQTGKRAERRPLRQQRVPLGD